VLWLSWHLGGVAGTIEQEQPTVVVEAHLAIGTEIEVGVGIVEEVGMIEGSAGAERICSNSW